MKSIQILFKTKGVIVEKWIVDGSTKVLEKTKEGGSKVIEKTKDFSKLKMNCETHEDILNTDISEDGIFCKTCGVRLKLTPAWWTP